MHKANRIGTALALVLILLSYTQLPAHADGIDVSARSIINRCVRYLPLIYRWNEEYFDMDPGLVLAVAAKESHCDPSMYDGVSVGLMAVTPRSWTASKSALKNPAINVYHGMYILDAAIHSAEHNAGNDVRRGLAAYNCGWKSLNADRCISIGGYAYADEVLDFWLPRVQNKLDQLAVEDVALRQYGYGRQMAVCREAEWEAKCANAADTTR